jgi:hypothetical protein
MIRKISKVISLLMMIGCLGFTVPVWGAEKLKDEPITYEMKEISVQYAAEFTVYPVGTTKPSVTTSVYEAVYNQTASPLKVLYGVVKLTMFNGSSFTEEFVSVTDGVYSTRGLSVGGGRFNPTTDFATGKMLAGSSVVKDYSTGWKTFKLIHLWDNAGNPTQFDISFNWDLQGPKDPFFQKLTETSYVTDLSSFHHVGGIPGVKP